MKVTITDISWFNVYFHDLLSYVLSCITDGKARHIQSDPLCAYLCIYIRTQLFTANPGLVEFLIVIYLQVNALGE